MERTRSGIATATFYTARQSGSLIGVAPHGSLIASGQIVPACTRALAISAALMLIVVALAAETAQDADA